MSLFSRKKKPSGKFTVQTYRYKHNPYDRGVELVKDGEVEEWVKMSFHPVPFMNEELMQEATDMLGRILGEAFNRYVNKDHFERTARQEVEAILARMQSDKE